MTTRASQAITTIQSLLWVARAGLLKKDYPDMKNLRMTATNSEFDENWKWLGSYATWRSAMFIWMYPENILYPTLREWKTHGFEDLVQKLQMGRRLNPEQAQNLAKEYAEYYKDITKLEVEATCHCQDESRTNRTYLYGRNPENGACYWSRFDDGNSSYPHTSWKRIPALSGTNTTLKLLAAVPFGESKILLFAKRKKNLVCELVFVQHNLGDGSWEQDEDPEVMELPKNTRDFEVVVSQTRCIHEQPSVVINNRTSIYINRLNANGNGWELSDWKNLSEDNDNPNFMSRQSSNLSPKVLSDVELKALVPVYISAGTTCYLVLFFYSKSGETIKYTPVKFPPSVILPPLVIVDKSILKDAHERGILKTGTKLHIDYFPFSSLKWDKVPSYLEGLDYIITDPFERYFSSEDVFITFMINAPVTVYIAYDPILLPVPPWLSSWDREDGTAEDKMLTVSYQDGTKPTEDDRLVFKKNFSDGQTIELNGIYDSQPIDWITHNAMYNIIIKQNHKECEIGNRGHNFSSNVDLTFPINDSKEWIGAFAWPQTDSIVVFFRDQEKRTKAVDLTQDQFMPIRDASPGMASAVVDATIPGTASAIITPVIIVGNTMAIGDASLVTPKLFDGDIDIDAIAIDSGNVGNNRELSIARKLRIEAWSIMYLNPLNPLELTTRGPNQVQPIDKEIDEKPLQLTRALNSESQFVRTKHTEQLFGTNKREEILASTFAYIEEYYYFVPLLLAIELQRRGFYQEALDWYRTVYDYSGVTVVTHGGVLPGNGQEEQPVRKIWYGLKYEEATNTQFPNRVNALLQDDKNPHNIASARHNGYTRFTLLSMIRCFLEYGDAEFTLDTPESVPRAKILYKRALELLDTEELRQGLNGCEELIAWVKIIIDRAKELAPGDVVDLNQLEEDLDGLLQEQPELLQEVRAQIEDMVNFFDQNTGRRVLPPFGPQPDPGPPYTKLIEKIDNVRNGIKNAMAREKGVRMYGDVMKLRNTQAEKAYGEILANPEVFETVREIGNPIDRGDTRIATNAGAVVTRGASGEYSNKGGALAYGNKYLTSAHGLTGRSFDKTVAGRSELGMGEFEADRDITNSMRNPIYYNIIPTSRDTVSTITSYEAVTTAFVYCVPPNPVLRMLRMHAKLNLYKAENCRNIAGMERELEPYAAPTDTVSGLPMIGEGGNLILPGAITLHPTLYRYPFLIEKAKQIVQLAGQIEAAMLSSLEKRDNEYYNLKKARQDMGLTKAGVQLQGLRVREAEDGVTLAELQRQRSQIQADYYKELLAEGLSDLEEEAMGFMIAATAGYYAAAASFLVAAGLGGWKFWSTEASAERVGQALSATASALSQTASIISTYASYERREQDWRFQKSLADHDILIGNQQIRLANDRVRIVGQERLIAEMQASNAEDTAEYLATKFTNVELYDWMSKILEGVYGFFLQHATTMSKLATQQLAFERQETPPPIIQDDYWEAPADLAVTDSTEGKSPERHGLTGSARLLQDIYRLDQYALETDKQKLQLTKTISLAHISPIEFQQFRETGVMNFATPMEMFDRDFPGHYLRLVKRVRTSVIALIPPVQGIRATLSTTGTSRVVIKSNYIFQNITRYYGPQSVALSSPQNATGLFELQQESEKLMPFEGLGVATTWELRMPRASNLFDYSTIADVLITIEYTALDDYDYRQQVIRELDTSVSGDRLFSFRYQLADQWYDLHNPDQTPTPMVVRFQTRREDFPPNLDNLKIQHVVLYFARANGQSFEVTVTDLSFTEQGIGGSTGGGSTSTDGVISTRRGNAGSWISMIGKSPAGDWELPLPNTEDMRDRFKNEEIEDILFIITYSGRTPAWPA